MNNNEKTNDWMHSRKHFPWGTPFIRRSVFIGNKKSFIHRISNYDICIICCYGLLWSWSGARNTSPILISHARRHRKKRRSWAGELSPKPEEGEREGNRNSLITIETFLLIGYPMRLFRDFILQGQPHRLPLHLASFRAYASSTSLPICLQGSIPDSWLAMISTR